MWDIAKLPALERPDDAQELARWVGQQTGPECDIRVLVPDAHEHSTLLGDLADARRCDVYVPKPGTELRDTPGGPLSVRVSSGMPMSWALIRPRDIPEGADAWFEHDSGRVVPREGVAVVELGTCVGFVTRASFMDTLVYVARTAVTPIVVTVEGGRFIVGHFDGTVTDVDGTEFGRVLTETVKDLAPEVRLALTWPAEADACAALDRELSRLARRLDRVVWVPARRGSAAVADGLTEPVSRGYDGRPAPWLRYDPANPGVSALVSRPDGRLVPASPIAAPPDLSPPPPMSSRPERSVR